MVPNISQESCKNQVTGDTPTGHQEMLEFFIIQTLIGEVVMDNGFLIANMGWGVGADY